MEEELIWCFPHNFMQKPEIIVINGIKYNTWINIYLYEIFSSSNIYDFFLISHLSSLSLHFLKYKYITPFCRAPMWNSKVGYYSVLNNSKSHPSTSTHLNLYLLLHHWFILHMISSYYMLWYKRLSSILWHFILHVIIFYISIH